MAPFFDSIVQVSENRGIPRLVKASLKQEDIRLDGVTAEDNGCLSSHSTTLPQRFHRRQSGASRPAFIIDKSDFVLCCLIGIQPGIPLDPICGIRSFGYFHDFALSVSSISIMSKITDSHLPFLRFLCKQPILKVIWSG
jgi:hypothetical protein